MEFSQRMLAVLAMLAVLLSACAGSGGTSTNLQPSTPPDNQVVVAEGGSAVFTSANDKSVTVTVSVTNGTVSPNPLPDGLSAFCLGAGVNPGPKPQAKDCTVTWDKDKWLH